MVRDTLKSWLVRAVEGSVESRVRAATEPLAERLGRVELRSAELAEENEKLKKKLSMATGAIQACTADLQKAKTAADQGANVAQQAMQRATSALAAAEAAAEGVTALELRAAEELTAPKKSPRTRKA
jgi:hypothetical protein